jgi:hypothetical protein
MTDMKLVYKDITEEESKLLFIWGGQELKLYCKHLNIICCDDDNTQVQVKTNYEAFWNHCEKVINNLLDLMDLDLISAWEIFYKYDSFDSISCWDYWDNVESFEDLNIEVKTYDTFKEKVSEMINKCSSNNSYIEDFRK